MNNERRNLWNDVPEDEIRLSVKIDRLDYLDNIPLEKSYKIYIVLTGKTVTRLQKDNGIIDTLLKRKDKIVFSLTAIMRDIGNGLETYELF